MTRKEALKAVTKLLADFLRRSEVEDVPQITSRTCPVGDLGLESDDGIDWICDLEDTLGIEVPGDQNPFLNEGRDRANTVDEIADWLVGICAARTSDG